MGLWAWTGLGMDFATTTAGEKTRGLAITINQKNDMPVSAYANNLPILDLKDQLPGDAIIKAIAGDTVLAGTHDPVPKLTAKPAPPSDFTKPKPVKETPKETPSAK